MRVDIEGLRTSARIVQSRNCSMCTQTLDLPSVHFMCSYQVYVFSIRYTSRGGGLGSRPKKMYGERLGDGVEYHLMSPTPHC